MTYDIRLNSDGDLPIRTEHITGPDLVAQRIRTRLQTFRGEWFLDERRGLPYPQWKQDRPVDIEAIGARIRREIRQTPGVIRVVTFEAKFSGGQISITGTVVVEDQTLTLSAEIFGAGDGNSQPVTVLLV